VRSEELEPEEIEFLRWRRERWMKLGHFPKAIWRSPGFVFHNGIKMLRHTFRGCTLRTFLHLEEEHEAFKRYRAIRVLEREYV
jgi:hypothetical protein